MEPAEDQKIKVDIITGLLDAGKTTFINSMLRLKDYAQCSTVVVQCEEGETEISPDYDVDVASISAFEEDCGEALLSIIADCQPQRMVLEANGMSSMSELIGQLGKGKLKRLCRIESVVDVVDADAFSVQSRNMESMVREQLACSDFVVAYCKGEGRRISRMRGSAGRGEKVRTGLNDLRKEIAGLGGPDRVFLRRMMEPCGEIAEELTSGSLRNTASFYHLLTIILLFSVALFALDFLQSPFASSHFSVDLSAVQTLASVFLGIMIQAIPFILIGALVSAVMQVLIPGEKLVRLFPQKNGLGFLAAAVLGLFFPVCDCAIVPVATRLVKKGVGLPVAVTFMLAAPAVNPIVIASTMYAFPGQPQIALYRVLFGVLIALTVGLVLRYLGIGDAEMLPNATAGRIACSCGCCGAAPQEGGVWGKAKAVVLHCVSEFFNVSRYLIMGALLSSIMQVYIPKDIISSFGGTFAVALLCMMALAFVLSVCSTSDAFIARTYTSLLPMGAVMGFMVLGAMVDIKNLLILHSSFRRKFVLKLVSILFVTAFAVLFSLGWLLQGGGPNG